MAAPSGTVFGGEQLKASQKNGGKVGAYVNTYSSSSDPTSVIFEVEVWFWSMYAIHDANNTLTVKVGTSTGSNNIYSHSSSPNIYTTVSTGLGWSTVNQIKLHSFSFVRPRTTQSHDVFITIKLADVAETGLQPMTYSVKNTVPALPTYTVTYNANGGTGAPSTQTKVYGTALTLSSTIPTKTGYVFAGWRKSTEINVSFLPGGTYTDNADLSLTAVWNTLTYSILYNANGGTGAPAKQTKSYGVTLKLSSTIPTRAGYTFKGWGTSSSATTVAYNPSDNYTKNVGATLYAIWELSYQKPRITDLSISRCDSDGNEIEQGTYALVVFNWACDTDVTEIKIEWKTANGAAVSSTVTASGTSGAVRQIVGDATLSTDVSYSFSVYVADASTYSYSFATLTGSFFAIDLLYGGKGVAVGKPAELDGFFEMGLIAKFTAGVHNEVFIKHNDLNLATTPNTYVSVNQGASYYSNCPVTSGTFVLEVMNAGAEGQIFQRLTTTFKEGAHQVYVRHYFQSSWGSWVLVYSGDTGWIDLTLQSGITYGSEMGYLKGRLKDGVLYIKGDVKGITANWKYFALLPAALKPANLPSSTRFAGVYNMSYFCGFNLTSGGQLYVSMNGADSWDGNNNVTVNIAICI